MQSNGPEVSTVSQTSSRSFGTFVRLWVLLTFSYVLCRLIFDAAVWRLIDLRRGVLVETLALPLGQALVYWTVTARRKT